MTSIDITIDKTDAIPIADQIYNSILRQILGEKLKAQEKLPTERELSEKLEVSRGTVKRAYRKLEQVGAIEIRGGSGSYVLGPRRNLEVNQKKEAAEYIASCFSRLTALGLSNKEIRGLWGLYLSSKESNTKITIMVLSNNHEILTELDRQLSYLSNSSLFFFTLSFFTIDNIRRSPDPIEMLKDYDLIIATSIDYAATVELVPMYVGKIIEATITPCTSTLINLSSLSRGSKVRIIYRTEVFRKIVVQTLQALGYPQEGILSSHEDDYNPKHHWDDGVGAVINFNESPVYINSDFRQRNEEFISKGGKLIYFEYRIDRASLIYIEDRIQNLLSNEK